MVSPQLFYFKGRDERSRAGGPLRSQLTSARRVRSLSSTAGAGCDRRTYRLDSPL